MKASTRTLAIALAFLMVFLSACTGNEGGADVSETSTPPPVSNESPASGGKVGDGVNVAMISGLGGFGDGAINDAVLGGLQKASEELGFALTYSEALTPVDYEQLLIEYAESGEYDLIFLCSSDGLDPVTAVGPDYPDQRFILYDVKCEGNGQLISEYFAKNEMGFIAGVLAALMDAEGSVTINGVTTEFEPSGKIGLVMGVEMPGTVPTLTGAAAGMKYVKPDYEYLYGIVGGWSDNAKNKELALSMYDQGVNFVFHNAGGGAMGIIAAAQERGRFMLGYDNNQTKWDPTLVIGCTRKQNEGTIMRVMKEFCETGKLAWGTAEENNAKNGGIFFEYNPDFEVPPEVQKVLEQVIQDLKDGKIQAPNTWEEVEAFDAVYGG